MTNKEKVKQQKEEINKLKELLKNREISDKRKRKFKLWFLKKIGTSFIGTNLKQSILNSINEFNKKKFLSKDTIADLSTALIKRFTRVGVFALLIGLLPIFLLFFQNRLLNEQNFKIEAQTKLFEIQNKRIEEQTYLAEASRRSSQMFIMGEVLSDINKEFRGQYLNSYL